MLIALQGFSGERPAIAPRLIAQSEAQRAINCKLWDGWLRPWFRPRVEQTTVNPGPTRSIYRMSDAGYWLHWSVDVDVVRGPIAGSQRVYWTGDGVPKFGDLATVAGVTQLSSPAAAGQNFVIVENARGFAPGESVSITLNSSVVHTTVITTVQASLNRLNLAVALASAANTGNAVVNNSPAYPHGSYPMGVPAPTNTLTAVAGTNAGTVTAAAGQLGQQTGTTTTTAATYSIDAGGIDGEGGLIDFEIDATFSGLIASIQSQDVTIRVYRDPAGDNEKIFESIVPRTFQGPAANQQPSNFNGPSVIAWSTFLVRAAANGSLAPPAPTESHLHFQYAAAAGPQTYRLTLSHTFAIATGESWTYTLRLSARKNMEAGLRVAPSTHGLREGDKVQFAGIEGTGSIADLNKAPVTVLRVDGNDIYVDSEATGTYTSGGTWTQVWDEEDLEARSYLYTYVATLDGLDMEGPPALPSAIINAGDNQAVTVTGFIDPTSLADGRPYRAIRVYRTSTGEESDAEFLYVGEIPLNTVLYVDTNRGTALGEVLPSADWDPPPTDLVGLTELPNGGLAGFRRATNEVCLCVPYQPHAWPPDYRHSMLDEIVGIGAFGTSLLVTTKGRPNVLIGTDPSAMSEEHIELVYPNLAKRGTVDMGYGIVYPTLVGLCYVAQGVAQIITKALFTEDQWSALNPASFVAAKFGERYMCFYDNGTERAGFVVDPRDARSSLTFIDLRVTEAWSDPRTDKLYLVTIDTQGVERIVEWNADRTGIPSPYRWRSREFMSAVPAAMRALKVDAEQYPVLVNLYGDGKVYDAIEVGSNRAVRISDKAGLATKWEVEIVGSTAVEAVYVATNMEEIRRYFTT